MITTATRHSAQTEDGGFIATGEAVCAAGHATRLDPRAQARRELIRWCTSKRLPVPPEVIA